MEVRVSPGYACTNVLLSRRGREVYGPSSDHPPSSQDPLKNDIE